VIIVRPKTRGKYPAVFFWTKKSRRRRLLAEPFSDDWLRILDGNVRQYALLPKAQQTRLRDRLRVFVAEKEWTGCDGLDVTDEMKVTIAAQACLLVLGIDYEYHYDRIQTVLIYPGTYLHALQTRGGLVQGQTAIHGEYWHRGPVIISWKNTGSDARRGGNLVFHEFAHHLDDLDGGMDGTPPLESGEPMRRWHQVVDAEYRRLVRDSNRGEPTLLDEYGAHSPAEFFAVATECFFEQPIAMRAHHNDLYGVLRDFYHQDPAAWPWPSDRFQVPDH
jgi:MtfA peptidase